MSQPNQKKPVYIQTENGNIGGLPSNRLALSPSLASSYYQKHWRQSENMFLYVSTYGHAYGDDTDRDGHFYVIFRKPPVETGNPRYYAGIISLWEIDAAYTGEFNDLTPATVTFIQSGESDQIVVSLALNGFDATFVGNPFQQAFLFSAQPESDGDFFVGELETHFMRTATLSLFTLPYLETGHQLPDSLAVPVIQKDLYPGEIVSTENLGDMIENIAVEADMSSNDVMHSSSRCLFQWGTPCGVWTDTSSYTNILPSTATIKIRIPDIFETMPSTVEVYPAAYVKSVNGTAGDPAYIKLTAGAQTWEKSFYSNSNELIESTTGTGLTVATGADVEIKVEIKAPATAGDEALLYTLGIWWTPIQES